MESTIRTNHRIGARKTKKSKSYSFFRLRKSGVVLDPRALSPCLGEERKERFGFLLLLLISEKLKKKKSFFFFFFFARSFAMWNENEDEHSQQRVNQYILTELSKIKQGTFFFFFLFKFSFSWFSWLSE